MEALARIMEQTSQLAVFLSIAGVAFLVLVIWFIGGSFFGADHDLGHDDVAHDGAGGVDVDGSTVSIFSPRIFCIFMLAFGASGAIATTQGCHGFIPSLWGLGAGFVFAFLAYLGLSMLHKQQANSVISTDGAIGKMASVTTTIEADKFGEVEVNVGGSSRTYTAISHKHTRLARGAAVKVVRNNAGTLVVESV